MYDYLTKTLSELGEKELQIQNVFLIKIGCVMLTDFTEQSFLNSRHPITELERVETEFKQANPKNETPGFYYNKIITALKRHPNIFDLKIIDKERVGDIISCEAGMLVKDKLFTLRVDLPDRLQKYKDDFPGQKKPIEKFEVVSSGSLFVAFTKIQDYPLMTYMAHEYREILGNEINKEPDVKFHIIGPSPIHTDFHCVIRKKQDGAHQVETKVYASNDDVFVVIADDGMSIRELAISFLTAVEFEMLQFYRLQASRTHLLCYYIEILSLFEDLSSAVKKLLNNSGWRLFRSIKFAHSGKMCLSTILTRFVKYEQELFSVGRRREEFLQSIKEDKLLSFIHSYFLQISDPDIKMPDALLSAVDHYSKEVRAFENIVSIVVASLLGAVAGSLMVIALR